MDELPSQLAYESLDNSVRLTPPVKWADQLYHSEFPPLRYVVDGMIIEGSMFMLVGRPKSGKSLLLLNLVRALSTNGKWLERNTNRLDAPIAYFPLEDGERRVWSRMRGMEWCPPPDTVGLIFDKIDLTSDSGGTLALLSSEYGFKVFIIDTLRAAIGMADENDNNTMGALLTHVATICHDLNLTLIFNHHTRKGASADNAFEALRGASAIRGAYDGGAVMFRDKNSSIATLYLESRDLENPRDLTIEWKGIKEGWKLVGYAEEVSMKKLDDEIVEALADGPLTLHQITEIVGANTNAVYEAIQRLIKQMRVVQTRQHTGGRGAPRALYAIAAKEIETGGD